jgi:hypothetical protein
MRLWAYLELQELSQPTHLPKTVYTTDVYNLPTALHGKAEVHCSITKKLAAFYTQTYAHKLWEINLKFHIGSINSEKQAAN